MRKFAIVLALLIMVVITLLVFNVIPVDADADGAWFPHECANPYAWKMKLCTYLTPLHNDSLLSKPPTGIEPPWWP